MRCNISYKERRKCEAGVNGVLHQTTRLNAEIESKFCGECAEAAREWGDFMLENFHHNLFE